MDSDKTVTHTPGPWIAWNLRDFDQWIVWDSKRKNLAHVHHRHEEHCAPHNSEAKANAHLIAAAPEMLEALRECVEALYSSYDVNDWPADGKTPQDQAARRAEEVIAKATQARGGDS